MYVELCKEETKMDRGRIPGEQLILNKLGRFKYKEL